MLQYNNKQYRNLEEQVQYLTEQHNIDKGLSEWGIRVLGTLDTADELPDAATYTGDYGDAYAVGTEPPYNFYIWTRVPTRPDAGEWFDYGDIAIVGPEGPRGDTGPQGPQGQRGSRWFSGTGVPTTTSGYEEYDYYINVSTGNIWHLHSISEGVLQWRLEGNIKGPQGAQGNVGPQGPKGDTGAQGAQGPAGPAGPVVDFAGIITNVDQLPDPSTVSTQTGYLQSIDGAYHVWIIIGGQWTDVGIFNGGTIVRSGGIIVAEWNADTKVDKVTDTSSYRRVYGVGPTGNSTMYNLSYSIQTNPALQIVCRKSDGSVVVPKEPIDSQDAASKKYVDDKVRLYIYYVTADIGIFRVYFSVMSETNYGENPELAQILPINQMIPVSGWKKAARPTQFPLAITFDGSEISLVYADEAKADVQYIITNIIDITDPIITINIL